MVRVVFLVLFCAAAGHAEESCISCTNFDGGIIWGFVPTNTLSEASGLAASARHPGVLWTHNDGSSGRIIALSTNGAPLANYTLSQSIHDMEEVAVGPGPGVGTNYLYLGDIGGSDGTNIVRSSVKVLRVAEPDVQLSWASSPRSLSFNNVFWFTLDYPDGSYDAETLLVDPITTDLFILTKEENVSRMYRANVTSVTNRSRLALEYIMEIPFAFASSGDISVDGTQIVIRREDTAMIWSRCTNETVAAALSREGTIIPVIGPPTEPNGEAIAFLRDGTGYVTMSEGLGQPVYFFRSICPAAPRITLPLTNKTSFVGGRVMLNALAVGYPPPSVEWRFNEMSISGETNFTLIISNLTPANAGSYSFVASNASGAAITTNSMTVRPRPDLRITEVMPSQAVSPSVTTADWWELTSFEDEPVSLEGWRFNDQSGGLSDAYTLNNAVTISPGESIVLVEGLTPSQFRTWWGQTNLPAGLQIITYVGGGLGLGAQGDGLQLWDAATSDSDSTVEHIDFGVAEDGVSFNYNPITHAFGILSDFGVFGVSRASRAQDIGSPGRIIAPPIGPKLFVAPAREDLRIEFDAQFGSTYSLETSPDLMNWSSTDLELQATNNFRGTFQLDRTMEMQYFRIKVE